ncbi:MAG: flagellar basal body rod protein FlgB [Candidatus Zixiibacteriota bacterium]
MSNIIKSAILDKIGVPKFRSYLNLSSLKHKLTAGNVSNVLTPGYRAREIDFQGEFLRQLDSKPRTEQKLTNPRHIPLGDSPRRPVRIIESKSKHSNGINNVNIDREMTDLAINQLRYTIAARMIKNKFTSLRKAITGVQ